MHDPQWHRHGSKKTSMELMERSLTLSCLHSRWHRLEGSAQVCMHIWVSAKCSRMGILSSFVDHCWWNAHGEYKWFIDSRTRYCQHNHLPKLHYSARCMHVGHPKKIWFEFTCHSSKNVLLCVLRSIVSWTLMKLYCDEQSNILIGPIVPLLTQAGDRCIICNDIFRPENSKFNGFSSYSILTQTNWWQLF